MPNLERLILSGCNQITIQTFLLALLPRLRELQVSGDGAEEPDAGLEEEEQESSFYSSVLPLLACCNTSLEEFYLDLGEKEPRNPEEFSLSFPSLRYLTISGFYFQPKGLNFLKLSDLRLESTSLSLQRVVNLLVSSSSTLEEISLGKSDETGMEEQFLEEAAFTKEDRVCFPKLGSLTLNGDALRFLEFFPHENIESSLHQLWLKSSNRDSTQRLVQPAFVRSMLRPIASSLSLLYLTGFSNTDSSGQQESDPIDLQDFDTLSFTDCSPSFIQNLWKDSDYSQLRTLSVSSHPDSTMEHYLEIIRSDSHTLRTLTLDVGDGPDSEKIGSERDQAEGKELVRLRRLRTLSLGVGFNGRTIGEFLSKFKVPKLETISLNSISPNRSSDEMLRINQLLKANAPLLRNPNFEEISREYGEGGMKIEGSEPQSQGHEI